MVSCRSSKSNENRKKKIKLTKGPGGVTSWPLVVAVACPPRARAPLPLSLVVGGVPRLRGGCYCGRCRSPRRGRCGGCRLSMTWRGVGAHVLFAVLLSHGVGAQVLGVGSWVSGLSNRTKQRTQHTPTVHFGESWE